MLEAQEEEAVEDQAAVVVVGLAAAAAGLLEVSPRRDYQGHHMSLHMTHASSTRRLRRSRSTSTTAREVGARGAPTSGTMLSHDVPRRNRGSHGSSARALPRSRRLS